MSEEPKQKFKRLLEGELIDWKDYALRLTRMMCEAEIREKEFCPDSRYFYQAMEKLYQEAGYTSEELDFLHAEFTKWYDENENDE